MSNPKDRNTMNHNRLYLTAIFTGVLYIILVVNTPVVFSLNIFVDNGKFVSGASNGNPLPFRKKTLDRFRLGNAENEICWDRSPEEDSFFSIIDTHNHFYPFGGPAVPFNDYFQWMEDAGILFSTMFGIGQLIQKKNQEGCSFSTFIV